MGKERERDGEGEGSPIIWTALVVAFLVYPTVLALKDAMVRPHPVPAAPISESTEESASTRGGGTGLY
jgi:hypothetical protein